MASQFPPKKNTAFTLYFTLFKNDGTVIANPGTYTKKISKDGGTIADISASVTEVDTTYGLCSLAISATEMNADAVWIQIKDDTTGCVPFVTTFYTTANLMDDIKTDTAAIKTQTDKMAFTVTNQIDANCLKIGGTTQTGRDIGASVLLSSGSGTGQLDFTSGIVKANLTQILATTLTETAGQIAAAFKKFFDKATPTGTINSLPDANAGANGGLPTTNGTKLNQTADLTAGQSIACSDKTGFALTAAYDAAKTAAQAGNQMDLVSAPNATAITAIQSGLSKPGTAQTITANQNVNVNQWNGGALPTIGTSTLTAQQVWEYATRTLSAFGFSVTVGTNNDKTGYTLTATPPTAVEIRTEMDSNSTKLANLDATITSRLATSGYTAPPASSAIADAVWDEAISGHLTSGTTGNALNAAGSAGDPWSTSLPGAYGSGTAGKIIGDNINTTISSRSSHTAADVWAVGTRTLSSFGSLVSDMATAVWAAGTRTLTAISDSAGITTLLTRISSALTITGGKVDVNDKTGYALTVTPPTAAEIKTAMEADGSKLDHLWEMTEDDAGVRRYTANALEQAPSGGLDAAGVRSAIGLATANLDTQLTAIVTDTNELQTDWANGGRLDTILDAAGAAGDPWITELPGSYTGNQAGHLFAHIKEKTDTLGGGGAITWTYTVTNSETGLPIADVDVWVTTDSAGANVIASGTTNASGVCTFYLDSGTVYVWCHKSGYSFSNPDQEVIS